MADETETEGLVHYKDFALDQFSLQGHGLGTDLDEKYGEWFVAPCTLTKGVSLLEQANHKAQHSMFKADGCVVYSHNLNNWAAGWVSIYLVEPTESSVALLISLDACLSQFPCIDDTTYSEMRYENIHNYWNGTSMQTLVGDCVEANQSIFQARDKSVSNQMFNYYLTKEDFQ